ncbi:ABATE domain-containing protein [Streptomyces lomondensis]|uniref:ABATE domain-containing protein n=1 Tax=Streptomyces lomondensis TaxID=68229 RepID=UPI001677DEC8|nr:ABATE domain-containing protein [Streptomyces lomondensis]MCF0082760.1 ABATE domain-containing protein [Streptomyces lomondensis]
MSGSPALDLVGTVGSRRDEPIDLLATPADLEAVGGECDGFPDRVTADLATFESALSPREAIYRLARGRVLDRPFDPGSLQIVNDTAAGPVPTVKLSDAGLDLPDPQGTAYRRHLRDFLAEPAVAHLADLVAQGRTESAGKGR